MRALEVIVLEERDPSLKKVIQQIRDHMDHGLTLSEAVARFPKAFSASVRELVISAEKTGAWDEIVQEIADGLHDGTFN